MTDTPTQEGPMSIKEAREGWGGTKPWDKAMAGRKQQVQGFCPAQSEVEAILYPQSPFTPSSLELIRLGFSPQDLFLQLGSEKFKKEPFIMAAKTMKCLDETNNI